MNPIKVDFKPSTFPKMLAELSHSNQFLKVFSLCTLALSITLAMATTLAFSRKPVVIALTPKGSVFQRAEMPNPDLEVRAAVQAYIEKRYNWDKDTVDKNLELAKIFVAQSQLQNFSQGVANVRKFSKERAVSQRAYAFNVAVDHKRSLVLVTGDRITEIQGVKAAGALNLTLGFQGGPRIPDNPWGVYITKEVEN